MNTHEAATKNVFQDENKSEHFFGALNKAHYSSPVGLEMKRETEVGLPYMQINEIFFGLIDFRLEEKIKCKIIFSHIPLELNATSEMFPEKRMG